MGGGVESESRTSTLWELTPWQKRGKVTESVFLQSLLIFPPLQSDSEFISVL